MHRIDFKRLSILGFVNCLIELQINVLLLVRQSASTIVIHICFMGLRNVSRIQWTTYENHKCKHFDYETTMSTSMLVNDRRLHLHLVSLYMT